MSINAKNVNGKVMIFIKTEEGLYLEVPISTVEAQETLKQLGKAMSEAFKFNESLIRKSDSTKNFKFKNNLLDILDELYQWQKNSDIEKRK